MEHMGLRRSRLGFFSFFSNHLYKGILLLGMTRGPKGAVGEEVATKSVREQELDVAPPCAETGLLSFWYTYGRTAEGHYQYPYPNIICWGRSGRQLL